jgi:phospholipase C
MRGKISIQGLYGGACASLLVAFGLWARHATGAGARPQGRGDAEDAIRHIRHVVVIMQENRSFDSYFGIFPGADGIPMRNGDPAVCVPDPASGACVKPYHDAHDRNGGGPHSRGSAIADVDGGKMDGFIKLAEQGRIGCTKSGQSSLRQHRRS